VKFGLRQAPADPSPGRRGEVAPLIIAIVLPLSLFAQQRDSPVIPVGTGEISGVVMSAGPQPVPVRRVVVSLSGDAVPLRSVITDDAGKFVFNRLSAGSFSITARKAAYLSTEHGSAKPGRMGSRIALAAGEKRAIALTIFKGAVIAGTLRDASGRPLAGVGVAAIDTRLVSQGANLSPEIGITDDRGSYRIFGLMPGEYVIAAGPGAAGSGEIGGRTAPEMDTLLSALSQRQNRAATTTSPVAIPPAPSITYAPVYYPGTPHYSEAGHVRVAAEEEREGMNFEVSHVPAATIEGVVNGDVANLASVQLALVIDGPRVNISTGGITSVPPNEKGEFKYGNLPPGRYRIVARARRGATEAAATFPGSASTTGGTVGLGGGPPPAGVNMTTGNEMVYGVVEVDVRGVDVNGVTLPMQPGGTFAGKVVFDAEKAPIPADLTAIRISTALVGGSYISQTGSTRVGTALSAVPPVNLKSDGTFLIVGLGPSQYTVTCQLPANLTSTWKLRSVMAGGRDLLDTLIDGPFVNLSGVTVTLSDKRTELSGTLSSASGQPVSDYYVVAFSADRANWRFGSRRNVSARPATDGRFILPDLPGGEYLLAALTDLDPNEWQDASFLEQVAPAAVKVTILEGQKKVQDLRIR
jgi:hypothetical protein